MSFMYIGVYMWAIGVLSRMHNKSYTYSTVFRENIVNYACALITRIQWSRDTQHFRF